jgi:hypothetical protein
MKDWMASSIAALLAASVCLSSQAEDVRVYRCTDAHGAVALQDTPCAQHQAEQVRDLRRPRESSPPPRAAIPEPSMSPPAAAPPSQVVVRHVDVRPLYECLRYDGERYESESGVPERHWVPLWVLGLDPRAPPDPFANVGRAPPTPSLSQPRAPIPAPSPDAYAAGAWVEDRCYRLPAAVACERQRARLSELGRRIFNAVRQSEREQMQLEQRGLRERLAAECN